MRGPLAAREWEAALRVLREAVGLQGRMPRYGTDAFVAVGGPAPTAPARM